MTLPIVAIVGRPNVGKSTLFNRIVGRREAIVEERPGVTRDRKELEAEWQGNEFLLVDTGGWLPGGTDLDEKVSRQSERAIDEAAVVLLVVDVTVGVTEEDARIAAMLRRNRAPALVVANKVDDTNREAAIWELVEPWSGRSVARERLARSRNGRPAGPTGHVPARRRGRRPRRPRTLTRQATACSRLPWSADPTSASRPCSIA